MNRSICIAAVFACAAGTACARGHLTPTHGKSSGVAFTQQGRASPKVGTAVSGLDPQEAAVISDAYLRRLAPKNAQVKEEPILLVAPPTQGGGYGAAAKLAPSVPKEK